MIILMRFKIYDSRFKNKAKNGFSLIELLVVISIIGVLSAVLVMNFVGARERSRDSQKIQNLNSLKEALRLYYNDNQTYPLSGTTCSTCLNSAIGASYAPGLSDSGIGYTYAASADGNSFTLKTNLEVGAGDDDINSQTKCGIGATNKIFAVCGN